MSCIFFLTLNPKHLIKGTQARAAVLVRATRCKGRINQMKNATKKKAAAKKKAPAKKKAAAKKKK
jgi:hypothetical protein